jgi:hypothetical protein
MKEQIKNMPVVIEMPEFKILSPGVWGGMAVKYFEYSKKIDLIPIFEGLPGNNCTCLHWGYMLKGALHNQYADGTEEIIEAGDMCSMPKKHTSWFEAGSAMVFFSPEADQKIVTENIVNQQI